MNTNDAPSFDLEYSEATRETPKGPSSQQVDSPEVPVKYQGKSVEDIIKMHQEAERLASRVGNDLAEQRRLTDALLDLKKTDNAKVPEKKPVTTDELFQDPNKAIEQAILNSKPVETVQETKTRLDQLEMRIGQKEFESRYPTYRDDLSDQTFRDWVVKNPARVALAQNADKFDFRAAGALWDMWSEHKELTGNKQAEEAQNDRKARTNAAKTVKTAAGETGRSKPVYSRAKLMELRLQAAHGDQNARFKLDDPDFQRELSLAYEEGRVR
jgi:hypothetical protein